MADGIALYSKGGGGNQSVVHAIQDLLAGSHTLRRVTPLTQVLQPLDPIALFSGNRVDCEQFYNWLQQHASPLWVDLYDGFGQQMQVFWHHRMYRFFAKWLAEQRPAFLLSCMQFINGPLADAAMEQQIPLLICPPDLDIRRYLLGISPAAWASHTVQLLAPLGGPWLREAWGYHGDVLKHLTVVGWPLRAGFRARPTAQVRAANRGALGIPEGRAVVALFAGQAGGGRQIMAMIRMLLRFADAFVGLGGIEVLVLTGKNQALLETLRGFPSLPGVVLHGIGFRPDIEQVLACADVVISKTGPTSVMEVLALDIPLLLNVTERVYDWERSVVTFVETMQCGKAICHLAELIPALLHVLTTKSRPTHQATLQLGNFAQVFPQVFERCLVQQQTYSSALHP